MSRLNFNISPYFDDFSSNKNYQRILFKPGFPVQTREMNQIQSTLQNQVEKFANHVFQNGTRVSNARANLKSKSYVRLKENSLWRIDGEHPTGYPVDLSSFNSNIFLTGTTSGIGARFIKGVNAENGDPPTLYVIYINTAIDGETQNFIPGETINFVDNNGIVVYSAIVKCPGCSGSQDIDTIHPLGAGLIFNIDSGIFYYEGMFIENNSQDIIVSKYGDMSESYKIGFDFVQSIITSDDDPSILDNALGYPNATAPGADRYKTELVLVKRTLNSDDGDNFILLATLEKGVYTYLKSDTEYADIMNMIAKRTFETNGDFTVEGRSAFNLSFIEDRAQTAFDPKGYSIDGDEDYIRAVVSHGTAYIQGYRYENADKKFLKLKKARDTKTLSSFTKRIEDRSYIKLKPLRGSSIYTNNPSSSTNTDNSIVSIYDGPFDQNDQPTGSNIGAFRVYDVVKESGTYNDTDPDDRAICRYYIYDIIMGSGKKLSDGQSFVSSSQAYNFKAEPIDDDVRIYNPNNMDLIWKIDRDNIKTLRSISEDPNPPGSIHLTIRKKLTGSLDSSGKITFNSANNEYFLSYNPSSTIAIIQDSNNIFHTLDLSLNDRISTTTTTLTINLGSSPIDVGGDSVNPVGKNIMIIHDVLRANAQEDKKQISFTTLTNISPTLNPILLGITDAFEIEYVKSYNPLVANSDVDITGYFTLNAGLGDSAYKESSVTASPDCPLSHKWRIKVNYYNHVSYNAGYFNVDSYKELIANNDMDYEDGPKYISSNKTVYPLLSSFDFRPSIVGNTVAGGCVPSIGSTVIFDIEYYIGRSDLLCINKNGEIYVKSGFSADTPVLPKPDENTMVLYEIYFKPYTYTLNDIQIKYIDNRRYTMRDIGKLATRISNVEYYAALSLLEKSAQTMNLKDSNGLDRFKNGFVVDDFTQFQSGDFSSIEMSCSLDRKNCELRPRFLTKSKKLELIESDALIKGKMTYIDYDKFLIDKQEFATKSVSINPFFIFRSKGNLVLSPNNDTWADTTTLPNVTLSVDTGVAALSTISSSIDTTSYLWNQTTQVQTTSTTPVGQSSFTKHFTITGGNLWTDTGILLASSQDLGIDLTRITALDQIEVIGREWIRSQQTRTTNNFASYITTNMSQLTQALNSGSFSMGGIINGNTNNQYFRIDQNQINQLFSNTNFGSWTNFNSTLLNNLSSTTAQTTWGSASTQTSQSGSRTTTVTTNITPTVNTARTVGSRTDSYNLGERVTDVSLSPYMRSVNINFIGTNLKPNTKLYAFFDDKPVSQYCREINKLTGSQLISDANGQIYGVFSCPANMFFVGQKIFYLTNDSTNSRNPDLEQTYASAEFFAGGLNLSTQETTMNVISPTAQVNSVLGVPYTTTVAVSNVLIQNTEVNSTVRVTPNIVNNNQFTTNNFNTTNTVFNTNVTNVSQNVTNVRNITNLRQQNVTQNSIWRGSGRTNNNNTALWRGDPLAQSFKLVRDYFLTGFDIFFRDIDVNQGEQLVWFQIRDMVNGYPGSTILGEKIYPATELTSSADSTVPFYVEFDFPIFLKGSTEYCFIVGGYSPGTTAWVARLGEEIINIPGKIVEMPPAMGSSFRSSNSSTWNAEQYEDLKYNLYVAKFKKQSMMLKFNPELEKTTLDAYPLESEAGKRTIRVYAPNHGFSANDNFTLHLNGQWIDVEVTSGQLQIGQRMVSNNFSATVVYVTTNQSTTSVLLDDIKGYFNKDEIWNCDSWDDPVRDNYLVSRSGYSSSLVINNAIHYNQVSGKFVNGFISTLNGIPIEEITKENIVKSVDSFNTFLFETTTAATDSGRFGGTFFSLNMNERYEIFNVSCSYLTYGTKDGWLYTGVGHNPLGENFVNYDYQVLEPKIFNIGEDNHLDIPHKLVSADNLSNGSLPLIAAYFQAPDEWTTPVVNLDTLSMITIANQTEWVSDDIYIVEPNANLRRVSESDPVNGNELYKYPTKTVVLKNSASDLVIAFEVYKDIDSDFDIWIKILESHENVNIDTKRWMKVVGYTKNHNSVDLEDRIEYVLTLSDLQVEVYSSNTEFTTQSWDSLNANYSMFKVKLVGRSKNPAHPTFFKNFRAIACT